MPCVNNINLTEYNFAFFILHTIEKQKQHKMKEWSLLNKRMKLFVFQKMYQLQTTLPLSICILH